LEVEGADAASVIIVLLLLLDLSDHTVMYFSGASVFSEFRAAHWLKLFSDQNLPVLRIQAIYEYWVELESADFSIIDQKQLRKLLLGEEFVLNSNDQLKHVVSWRVFPRWGTISPWSTKATDIVRRSGLDKVKRVERAVYWQVTGLQFFESDHKDRLYRLTHDAMTENIWTGSVDAVPLFQKETPRPLVHCDLGTEPIQRLSELNVAMGLALNAQEIEYLVARYQEWGRSPTDAELLMFAQANSEHCRHKIFNANWVIDGVAMPKSLFQWIKATHEAHPEGTVVAYRDNAAILEGRKQQCFYPDDQSRVYRFVPRLTHYLAKVETHNHPTAISPFAGAATGSGGEIRDEGATGIGSKSKAGLSGFMVSQLNIPNFPQVWEKGSGKRPKRISSALQIMLEGPIGSAAFNNEFGRPQLAGFFRTLEITLPLGVRGYHKPIMLAGGIGAIDAIHAFKKPLRSGVLFVHLGGAGMRIGLGGGAASSMQTGSNQESLDFDSVQRANPEMQRRAQEVIDRCWQLGEYNPIMAIHDVGAGGLSNAFPELAHDGGVGATFDLRAIPVDDLALSPREIWSNESQERYVVAIDPEDRVRFEEICARERCPVAVVGEATSAGQLRVWDDVFQQLVVDMPLQALIGKTPPMVCQGQRVVAQGTDLPEATPLANWGFRLDQILSVPAIADKTFLISIGDRTVGGLCARDPFVGPWQVPVADVAVTMADFMGYYGEAFALGERSPVALIDGPASGRLAVAEAINNLLAASWVDVDRVHLSANWMAAAQYRNEGVVLYDTVQAVSDVCLELGLSIPVGKDSLSMHTQWDDAHQTFSVVSPVSVVITAFTLCSDVRQTLTPLLTGERVSRLYLIDLGQGKNRLGGSAWSLVQSLVGTIAPDLDDVKLFKAWMGFMQNDKVRALVQAYHDRSDGGVLVTVLEMLMASRMGLEWQLPSGMTLSQLEAFLYTEELGAVVQVRDEDWPAFEEEAKKVGLLQWIIPIGVVQSPENIRLKQGETVYLERSVRELHSLWSRTSYEMQALRDHPDCAQEEWARRLDTNELGLAPHLTFDLNDSISAPFLGRGTPRVAILREQGVNGHVEMAAAFTLAGFEAQDVTMTDLLDSRVSLDDFVGIVACGGFSYGDVLGAGGGWAKSILFQPSLRDKFQSFFERTEVFALGVCNGCQMFSQLTDIIPGSQFWPRFQRNRSEQFEARLGLVEVVPSPSLFFQGMEGSRLPVPIAHGEGRAQWVASDLNGGLALQHMSLRYVEGDGRVAVRYPANPNGSPEGLAGLTTADGRFTICMPHPERAFRTVQLSHHPKEWGERGPWMRFFENARRAIG